MDYMQGALTIEPQYHKNVHTLRWAIPYLFILHSNTTFFNKRGGTAAPLDFNRLHER